MKRKTALVLALLMFVSLFPFAVSHAGSGVPVTVNGETRTLDWDKINIKDGVMKVLILGFEKRDKGEQFGTLAVIAEGREIRSKKAQDDGKGGCTYYFDCSAMPDAILFYPADDPDRRILIWKSSSFGIRSTYVGEWVGTAVPMEGGNEFTVTASLEFDGKGQFKYLRGDSGAMLPFVAQVDGRDFEAKVADGVMPITELKGKLKYSRTTLYAKITVVYRDGGEETFDITFTRKTEDGEE